MKVVLDSNALLLPFEGVDIIRQIERMVDGKPEYVVFEQSVNELSSKSRKEKMRLAAVLEGLKKAGVEMVKGEGKVDDMIVDYCTKRKFAIAVCTEDRELRKRLRSLGGVQLLYSKRKMRLVTDWQRNDWQ